MKIFLVYIYLIPINLLAQVGDIKFNPEKDGSNFYIRTGSTITLAKYFIEEPKAEDLILFSNKDSITFYKWCNYLKSETFINKTDAIESAERHFNMKGRNSKKPMLICDNVTNAVFWKITRQTGFMNVTEESILIDARTQKFLDREYYEYQRSFFTTIGDFFTGFY